MFPLMYGGPTLEQQAEQMGNQQQMPPGGMPDGMQQGPLPMGLEGPMMDPMQQAPMPGDMQPEKIMPEQMSQAGALPINPMV